MANFGDWAKDIFKTAAAGAGVYMNPAPAPRQPVRIPAAPTPSTFDAPNYTMPLLIGGGVLLLVLVIALRK